MAEKSSELNDINGLDPVSPTAGAGTDSFIEKYSDPDPENELVRFDKDRDNDDASERTELIKAQIEETRSNMGETIDAIQDRLSFSNISEQVSEQVSNAIDTAKDSVYDATIGKVADYMKNAGNEISRSSIVTTARENPLPFVLIGLGAGLLAYNTLGKKQRRSPGGYRADYRARTDYPATLPDRSGTSILTSAQEKIRGVKDSVSGVAERAYEGVSGAAGNAYSGAGDLANRAYEKAGEFGTRAQETYSEYLEEKPWAIGAVALVAGAAVGLAIPSTRYEGELMGEARYNLMAKAQDTASDFVDKAKNAATEAGRTIAEETKSIAQETFNN
ncbi:MAG: DUF3618 domain-containing protein [Saprospiraceae bacterium]|nr:DUF3618 domain-containing protein [Pyrinomonadaceae bacterium]